VYKKLTLVLACAGLLACQPSVEHQTKPAVLPDNALTQEWLGPYNGVPAFDQMNVADLAPALRFGMQQSLAEIDAITTGPQPATFENTMVPLEKVGALLDRVYPYYGLWLSNLSTPEVRKIAAELAPELSEFSSKISQNKALFERVAQVYEQRNELNPEQRRVVELSYQNFISAGVQLDEAKQNRYADINKQLAELRTSFANNVLHDEENYVTFFDESQLAGLPESYVKSAAAAAEAHEQPGKYAVTNTRSSMDPFLRYADDRALREVVWNNYYSRGDNGDEFDNNQIIVNILQLRDERSKLLGYNNFAEWQLADRMAKVPAKAMDLMMKIWPAAISRVKEEVADMQALADSRGDNITIAPWDYRYYAEKVRLAKYDLDSNEVKNYLQLDKLREAMFYVAGRLFNFAFTPVEEGTVPVFHPDVKVWEVKDKTSGALVGLWYLDPYARTGKRSGAWATSYRSFNKLMPNQTVLSANNSNFIKGAEGEPVLVSWDDAETFFHEFGHALHSLSSNVTYPSLNGGVRDYTEFQSQLLERWLLTDEVINNFLTHVETGEPMPASLVEKINKAATFNEGFKTTEYLASAIMDMKYHTMDPTGLDVDSFERDTLKAMGMPDEVVMRHRSPHFGHIFSGESYAAGYYGYIWAEVLTSDAAEAFAEAPGGFYDEAVAKLLVDYLFSVRNAMDPAEAYRMFRGRDANVDALMRDRGFID
jgi:peptidyl-dipeptidase Dcp